MLSCRALKMVVKIGKRFTNVCVRKGSSGCAEEILSRGSGGAASSGGWCLLPKAEATRLWGNETSKEQAFFKKKLKSVILYSIAMSRASIKKKS